MSYLTERFQKIVKKHGVFQEERKSNKIENANYIYHRCGKPGNFMSDCQNHKHGFQYFKERRRDQVSDHAKGKTNVDQVVKKFLTISEYIASAQMILNTHMMSSWKNQMKKLKKRNHFLSYTKHECLLS